MDIKKILNFKFSGNISGRESFKKFIPKCKYCWACHYRIFFAILFFVMLGGISYFWYQKIYHYQWDEARKQNYLLLKAREMKFKEKEFEEIIKEIDKRSQSANEDRAEIKELFKPEEIKNN